MLWGHKSHQRGDWASGRRKAKKLMVASGPLQYGGEGGPCYKGPASEETKAERAVFWKGREAAT